MTIMKSHAWFADYQAGLEQLSRPGGRYEINMAEILQAD
jgi:hypothetical protein